jgi:hypothetical protein
MRHASIGTAIGIVAALALVAGSAQAGKVDLSGGSSVTSGLAKIKIEDFGTCSDPLTVTLNLGSEARTFVAQDDEGRTYTGTYKQKKPQGRKLLFELDSASKKTFKKALKEFAADCLDVAKVKASLKSVKLRGKVNADIDTIKLRAKVKAEGQAGGERGSAVYSFKTLGALTLP